MAPEEMRGLMGLAGRAATLEILLEGRIFDAAEARSKGLLTRVVADGEVAAEAARAARRLMRGAPLAARLNKQTAARLSSEATPLGTDEIHALFRYAESHDHREGVRAFLAGEDPIFSGD
jgi:enoyl-CoA hydratase/carnithine racemase